MTLTGQTTLKTRFGLIFHLPDQVLGATNEVSKLKAMRDKEPLLEPPVADATRGRLYAMLIGLDGSVAGLSHRKIAIYIYRADLVDRMWNDIVCVPKDRTVRALKWGRPVLCCCRLRVFFSEHAATFCKDVYNIGKTGLALTQNSVELVN